MRSRSRQCNKESDSDIDCVGDITQQTTCNDWDCPGMPNGIFDDTFKLSKIHSYRMQTCVHGHFCLLAITELNGRMGKYLL